MLNFFEGNVPVYVQVFLKKYCKNDILQSLENMRHSGQGLLQAPFIDLPETSVAYLGSIIAGYDVLLVTKVKWRCFRALCKQRETNTTEPSSLAIERNRAAKTDC
jgi:hypothetical protein